MRKELILWSCFSTLAACGPASSPPPQKQTAELVMAMRPGPTTWFVGPDGDAAGFDRELVELFALDVGLPLRIVPVDSALQLLEGLASGAVQIGAGGLIRPPGTDSEGARRDSNPAC